MNRWMGQMLSPRFTAEPMNWVPEVDLVDTDGEFVLTAEVPGMKKDEIEIDIQDNVLTLRGEKKETKEHESKHHRYLERRYGSFERSFSLPRSVDAEKVKADYKDGVLTVHLAKSATAEGRKIAIQ